MNKEHSMDLYESAPIFYSGKDESKNPMVFGFACGDGWFYPLKEFSEKVEAINIFIKKYGIYVKAFQIKEKFGTLRVYFDVICRLSWWKRVLNYILKPFIIMTNYRYFSGFEESFNQKILARAVNSIVNEMVNYYVEKCMDYCEECGTQFGEWNKDEKVQTVGWIRIICKECAEKNNLKYVPFNPNSRFTENFKT